MRYCLEQRMHKSASKKKEGKRAEKKQWKIKSTWVSVCVSCLPWESHEESLEVVCAQPFRHRCLQCCMMHGCGKRNHVAGKTTDVPWKIYRSIRFSRPGINSCPVIVLFPLPRQRYRVSIVGRHFSRKRAKTFINFPLPRSLAMLVYRSKSSKVSRLVKKRTLSLGPMSNCFLRVCTNRGFQVAFDVR